MDDRWKRSSTCVYNLGYHIIFCTKYRKKLLVGEIEKDMKALLQFQADKNQLEIASLEVMPEHVHIFVKCDPTDSPHRIVQQFKGATSRILREKYRNLRKLPTLWTRSYYIESVGHISEETISKYISEQKLK
jgi:putative transposase